MIDVHIHITNTGLPGMAEKTSQDGTSFGAEVQSVANDLKAEMQAAGITQALCMPKAYGTKGDPLGINATIRLATLVPGLHAIGVADPTQTDGTHLNRVEEVLETGKVKAFKAYVGYIHYGPDFPGFVPYYRLAAKYKIPFIFHSGDTYSERAKVKYAHPLLIDEVAVDNPEVNFVIAHFGNPWLVDAAEVVYKNNKRGIRENVYVDLSGFIVGKLEDVKALNEKGVYDDVIASALKAFVYTECPDRFMYGSDWPLVPMQIYRSIIEKMIPMEHHAAVFNDTAKALFKI